MKVPDWLTGGSFGVEQSILALVICTTTGIVLLALAARRGKVVPPDLEAPGLIQTSPDCRFVQIACCQSAAPLPLANVSRAA